VAAAGLAAAVEYMGQGESDVCANKAILHIDTWLPQLEQAYATPTQRDNAAAGGNDPEALAASARISKIDMLRNQWTNNRPVWNNPF